MYRFDKIPACDGRTDGRTCCCRKLFSFYFNMFFMPNPSTENHIKGTGTKRGRNHGYANGRES